MYLVFCYDQNRQLYNMIRNLNKTISINRLTRNFLYKLATSKQFKQMLSKKQFLEILGVGDKEKNIFQGKDLHHAYLNQIKKYHSDGVDKEESKKQYDQITKCITQAYDELKKRKGSGGQESQIFIMENLVAKELFGKSYIDIKHNLYAPGNEQMRFKFISQLEKRRSEADETIQKPYSQANKNNPSYTRSSTNNNTYGASQTSSRGEGAKYLGMLALICAACLPFFLAHNQKTVVNGVVIDQYQPKVNKIREYSEKQYDIIHLNTIKIAVRPFERFYNLLTKSRPHIIEYPTKDPDILQQLATYSIAPDIHLYEVPSKYFTDKNQHSKLIQGKTAQSVPKYELKQTKPNTLLTLSLQAQRSLHNVYIKVDDIIAEIKETGKFTPPKVFFKFHGFMMVQIRDKPFSNLLNYRNTKYISLFELYFDYYSPIFFKRDYYKEYLIGYRKEDAHLHTRYFGNVYLNHRKIPLRYLEKGEKVAIMRQYNSCLDTYGNKRIQEIKYMQDWEDYYSKYEKNWKKYCRVQIQQEVQQ